MKAIAAAAIVVLYLSVSPGGIADPVSDANDGLDALNKGDFASAVQLFTHALSSGGLSPTDREYAYVKRGQAYLGQHETGKANADFAQALKLNPKDSDAIALSRQAHQPAAGQTANGPSLAVTLDFIVTMLTQQGPVNFVGYIHDSIKNTDFLPITFATVLDNFSASPEKCELTLHANFKVSGQVKYNEIDNVLFNNIDKITVETYEEAANKLGAKNGHPQITQQDNPTIYVVGMQSNGKDTNQWLFYDQDMADRVAKALTHATELCGGGKASPF